MGGGGGKTATSTFIHIPKKKQISISNFAYPFLINFTHPDQRIFSRLRRVGPKWRQSDVMFFRFRSKIRMRGNRRQKNNFKDISNWLSTKLAE